MFNVADHLSNLTRAEKTVSDVGYVHTSRVLERLICDERLCLHAAFNGGSATDINRGTIHSYGSGDT